MEDRIRLTIADGIADVRLNRAAKMNALDPAMFLAIAEAGARLKDDRSLRAVVLSGEGRAFCAGLDVERVVAVAAGSSILPFADLAEARGFQLGPAHRLALARASRTRHRRGAWHRFWRRLPARTWRRSAIRRARYASVGHRDQMGPRAGHGWNPTHASSGARRRSSRADLHRADLLRRGGTLVWVRHAIGRGPPGGGHGYRPRDRRTQPRRNPRRQTAAEPSRRMRHPRWLRCREDRAGTSHR